MRMSSLLEYLEAGIPSTTSMPHTRLFTNMPLGKPAMMVSSIHSMVRASPTTYVSVTHSLPLKMTGQNDDDCFYERGCIY